MRKYLKYEESAKMIGWDFSFLNDKIIEEPIPWNYKDIIEKHLRSEMKLLDMETGGGEFLLTLEHPYNNTFVTEGYEPNYIICLDKLNPLGIDVKHSLGEDTLPYDDSSFDIIINRHGSYVVEEIKRVLKSNGIFITQQVGSTNNRPMSDILTPWRVNNDNFSLVQEIKKFKLLGFTILEQDEAKLPTKYLCMEGVIFIAKIIEWEFPEFSVDKCYDSLRRIDEIIKSNGHYKSLEHRFMFAVRNDD